MTAPVVVLVEEPSIRIVIDEIGRKLEASDLIQVLEHEGKSDLEKSIPRKINGWRSQTPARFIISRDLDLADRQALRSHLLGLVPEHAVIRTKVRIIVPELESWYLGDPEALLAASLITPAIAARFPKQAKFRNLCTLNGAKTEFHRIVGHMGQIGAARRISPHLDLDRNTCRNFHAFVEALRWAVSGARTG
ncbi:MAG: hypothetical protein PGN34_21870 [Methylobacterium frigidaeris]